VSTYAIHRFTCECGLERSVEVAAGIHITRLPDARRRILERTFQVFECPSCGHMTRVEAPAVYTDFDRHEYVAVETRVRAPWPALFARHQAIFDDSFLHGPSLASDMGVRFRKRVVVGFLALREKLLTWDAALDDLVVEAVKGDLLAGLGLDPAEALLRLEVVLDGGHLMFAQFDPPPALDPDGEGGHRWRPVEPVDFVTAPAARYLDRLDARASIADVYPWLAADWLVDLHHGLELAGATAAG
jgi:hypothetical protein